MKSKFSAFFRGLKPKQQGLVVMMGIGVVMTVIGVMTYISSGNKRASEAKARPVKAAPVEMDSDLMKKNQLLEAQKDAQVAKDTLAEEKKKIEEQMKMMESASAAGLAPPGSATAAPKSVAVPPPPQQATSQKRSGSLPPVPRTSAGALPPPPLPAAASNGAGPAGQPPMAVPQQPTVDSEIGGISVTAGVAGKTEKDKCEANPACSSGTYDATANQCKTSGSYAATLSGGTYYGIPVRNDQGHLSYAGSIAGYLASTRPAGGLLVQFGSWSPYNGSAYLIESATCYSYDGPYICDAAGYISSVPLTGATSQQLNAINGLQIDYPWVGGSLYGYMPTTPGTYGGTYTCPTGGTLSGTTCNTTSYSAATCPSGTSLDGASDKCVANPTCTGGTVDGTNDVCYYAATACDTSAGLTYDVASGQCAKAAVCSDGSVLSTTADLCTVVGVCSQLGSGTACPTGYTEDVVLGICYSTSVCAPGSYVSANGRCEASVTKDCGTYTWDNVIGKCSKSPACPQDASYWLNNTIAYSAELDVCVAQPDHICPTGTTWNTVPVSKCEAVPICDGAIYYDPLADKCLTSVGCPYGSQYTCMQNPSVGNKYQCSPNPCVQTEGANAAANTAEPLDQTYYDDDGERDAAGNCLGTVYIFSGKPGRCRPPGWTVGMINNCCEKGDVMPENTGTSLSIMGTMYDLAKMASAMYQAAQGWAMYTNAVTNLQQTPTQAMDLVLSNLTSSVNNGAMTASQAATQVGGAQAAQAGASQASAMGEAAVSAGKGLAAAAITYAVGAIIKALGGDQDSQMVGSAAAMAICGALFAGPQVIIGIVVMVVMRVLMGSGCEPSDITTAGQVKSKRCHFVGDYCEKKWALVGCVQQAKGYCCYNSMMARIINEQGRPQLTVFGPSGGWGEPNKPECRGFTPDEFQALDFSRIDLSEYFDVVQKDLNAKIQASQSNIANSVQRKFEDMKALPAQ